MKKIAVFLSSIFVLLSCCGCHRTMGAAILEMFGVEFTSQIEMLEECLSVNLDDLTDDYIETLYSHTDPDGNNLTIRFLDLNGTGEYMTKDIAYSDNWNILPWDAEIDELLDSSGAKEHFEFESIKEGYFAISGVCFGKNGFDFDKANFDNWDTYEIGIWDSNAETLYHISITIQ